MAVISAILGFSGDACQKTTALAATTASGEIVLGPNAIFAIRSGGTAGATNFNLLFGNSGMAAPTAANFLMVGDTVFTLQTGDHSDRIRVFNPNASTIDVYVQRLDRY